MSENSHPAHQGFVSADERDWVLARARSDAAATRQATDPGYYEVSASFGSPATNARGAPRFAKSYSTRSSAGRSASSLGSGGRRSKRSRRRKRDARSSSRRCGRCEEGTNLGLRVAQGATGTDTVGVILCRLGHPCCGPATSGHRVHQWGMNK